MDALKVHEEALKRFKLASEAEHENRLIAEDDFLFASGDEQWPESVRQEREEDGRPCLTINRLPQFIRQVMGDARQNKPAIKVRPVEDSDEEIAEIYEGLIRSIETSSNAPQAYMTALEHCLTGGFGNFRIITEYCDNKSFDQDIKIKPIRNPFAVFWDPNAKEYDRSDAEWCFVTEWLSKEAYQRRYPNKPESDWEEDYALRTDAEGWMDANERVRVAEYWVKEKVKRKIYQIGDQVFDELPEEAKGMPGIRSRTVHDVKIKRYLLSGDGILEDAKDWAGEYIPIIPVWGIEEFVSGNFRYMSLIRHAKDPQRMFNYWQSTITEKIALAPKSPWLVTADMIKGLESFWNNANNQNFPYLPFNADPRGGIPQRTNPAQINAAEIAQAAQSIDDMKATTGIYDASLGARGNETSGVAIRQRQLEGDTSVYSWIDNLARSIEHCGRVLVDLIPKIYDTTRVVRILGEDDSTTDVMLNQPEIQDIGGMIRYKNDLSVGKYDVKISIGPSYATKRQEAADSMLAFIQAYPIAAQLCGDLVAKSMDWPGADEIAERLKQANPLAMAEDPEYQQQAMAQQQQQEQVQQQQLMLQMQNMAAEAAKKMAEANKTLQEIDRGKAEIMEILAQVHKIEADIEAQRIENAHFASQPEGKTSYSSGS